MVVSVTRSRLLATVLSLTAAFVPGISSWSAPALAQVCCDSEDDAAVFDRNRLDSARALTDQAVILTRMNIVLNKMTGTYIAALEKETPREDVEKGSVKETAARTKATSENFQQLMLAYQNSRRLYLQHKLLYDEHVAAYHHQPQAPQYVPFQQQQSSEPAPLAVPPMRNLRLKAQDACNLLQQSEFALNESENQIANTVNVLSEERGKIDPNVYFAQWNRAQQMGIGLQNQVVNFGRGVLAKETTSEEQLSQITQSAVRNGDFVESRDAYSELQRRTAVNNEETQRAHLHTVFSAHALNAISALGPMHTPTHTVNPLNAVSPFINGGSAAPGNAATPAPGVTSDQIVSESQNLQNEYDRLQQQYSELEKANPSHVPVHR